MKRILALCLLLSLLLCALPLPAAAEGQTLRVSTGALSGRFSPFFAFSAEDMQVSDLVSLSLLESDREGAVVLDGIEGETRAYNGTDYHYDGIASCAVAQNEDGSVDYNITLREDVSFSDGEPLGVDDVLFTMYALADPTYDGSNTFSSLPIEGMEAYHSGMTVKWALILSDGKNASAGGREGLYTAQEASAFWPLFDLAGQRFAQEIVDYCINNYADYGAVDVQSAAELWGYPDLPTNATAKDFWNAIVAKQGMNPEAINIESAGSSIESLIYSFCAESAPALNIGVVTGQSAANISGIRKTGSNTLTVHMTRFDATAIYSLAIPVAPLHYYGQRSLFDAENDQFGFVKGDLSSLREKNGKPLGAGPYVFEHWNNGVVTLAKNPNYYRGTPKIDTICLVENTGDIADIVNGSIDITSNQLTPSVDHDIRAFNSGAREYITALPVDNLGYGYIGLNADLIRVGSDRGSRQSKSLRKAFATVFSVFREAAVQSYYGNRAKVIEYPISDTSWAAPKPSDEGYRSAYSLDCDGDEIYTPDMTEAERIAAAKQAAKDYFLDAGYTWNGSKFTKAPLGASLQYEAFVNGNGVGDQPACLILTSARELLAELGITLKVNDIEDANILWDGLDANSIAIWAAAWGAAIDPDMYQVYHSDNVTGKGTGSNHYYITDDALDEMILQARSLSDRQARKELYKQCLDTILDWGVEVPFYQRQNVFCFSAERIDADTLTPDITTFWDWMHDLEKLELRASAEPVTPVEQRFVDVHSGDWFRRAVIWAISREPQVTSGTDTSHFTPKKTCTRAEVVQFLWNAAGCPEPSADNNPFQDVSKNNWFYKAVLWAVENGVTSGTTATSFSPNKTCTRAEVVQFLWNAASRPEPTVGANPFRDVSRNSWFYKAVLWAVENSVTSGTTYNTFSPNKTCTRAEVVQFLFQAD